jgi:glycolate oxidase
VQAEVANVVKEIEEIVGEGNLSTESIERYCYSRDFSFIDVEGEVMPDVIVWPTSAEQISQIVMLANRHKIPVVPRGAGTGEHGGAMPIRGGILLDLTKMNRILEIDEGNMTCLVEPGVVVDNLAGFLAKRGFFLPPAPASSEACTVGGNAANNSAGYRTVKYGSYRNWVLGLQVVLPNGEIIWTGSKTRKTSSGYDLTRLFVGSEGTLGVFTKIRLRIHPLPESRKVLLAFYNNVNDACQTIVKIMASKIFPSSAEIMDKTSIDAVARYGIKLPKIGGMAIVELDGSERDVMERLDRVREIALQCGAIETRVGASAEEDEELWRARKSVTPAFALIRPNVIDEDIAVPVTKLPELFRRIEQLCEELKIEIATYGHAGDGNLHPDILFDQREPDQVKRAIAAVDRLRQIAIDLGGTITGEHGIGLRRAHAMTMEHTNMEIDVMRSIKRALDPSDIMNPGKIYP